MKILVYGLFLILGSQSWAQYANQSELTTVVNGGNTQKETFNTKTLNTYMINKNTFRLGGHYTYGKSGEDLDARNWDIHSRYQRGISKKWSIFTAAQREEDFFASIDYRWNYDLGGSYQVLKNKRHEVLSEAGFRRSLESDLEGNKQNNSKLRLYSEYTYQIDKKLLSKTWVENTPNFTESSDWQLNIETSLSVFMTEILALKLAYLYQYDNDPAEGSGKIDYKYTTSLQFNFSDGQ